VAPLIRMAFQTTPGIGGPGLVLGFLRVNAKYTVRGRRAQLLPVTIRVQQYTEQEREEALRYLERERIQRSHSARVIHSMPSIQSLNLDRV
jgi:hypothetical protein